VSQETTLARRDFLKRVAAAVITAAALLPVCAPAVSAAEAPEFATVVMRGDTCIVKHEGTEKVLFESAEPRRAIEWALNHSRIAVLKSGEFNVAGSVRIPRSGVSLIIAKEATLQPAEKAELDIVSEGHGDYPALIHNKGMDHVAVINLGTLRGPGRGCASIMYNGRSGGKIGIDGGLVFSAGTMPKSGDAIWLIDSKNLRVPFAADKSYDNNLMAIEGCEDLEIGVVAGLAGSNPGENEAIDLNSYSRRIHIRHMIGASYSEQILDVNNSTDITVDKITGYTGGGKFNGHLVDIINYSPTGRRLTQMARIPESKNVKIHEKGVADEKIGDWKIAAEVEGDMLNTLPEMRVTVRLIGNPDKEKVTVFEGTYQFDLKAIPQKCQSLNNWPPTRRGSSPPAAPPAPPEP